tara:strand:- start:2146 stop:3069 length:924 start_codon:yes stop_codon:yes gene_type:complete
MSLIVPENIFKKFKKGKSKNTVKTYISMVSKLFRECFNTDQFSVEKLKDTDKVAKYLNKLSTTSIKIITIGVVMLLKAANAPKNLIDSYGRVAREYRIKDLKERQGRAVTEEEQEAYIPWSEVINIRTEYRKMVNDKSYVNTLTDLEYQRLFMRYLTLALFTMIPPQRGEVYFNCYIDKNKKGQNYIDTNTGILHIREHKTRKTYGDRAIKLPKTLVDLIKSWKTISNCKKGLLLCNSQGNNMSSQGFTQFINSIFESGISTDMLRKIYITHMYDDIKINDEQKEKLARMMGHSRSVQKEFYHKPDF